MADFISKSAIHRRPNIEVGHMIASRVRPCIFHNRSPCKAGPASKALPLPEALGGFTFTIVQRRLR